MSLKEVLDRAAQTVGTYSREDLERIGREQSDEFNRECNKHRQEFISNRISGRSGIPPLHQDCTIENYQVHCPEQQHVCDFSRWFIDEFRNNQGSSFVFSGESGTGKNHLAAAICNELIQCGQTCLIITITELMIKIRRSYDDDSGTNEDDLIKALVNLDLLIIDEIGLQRKSTAENILINQIIDQRLCNLKPTGILTNLNKTDFMEMVGVRVDRRLKEKKGKWLKFNWECHLNAKP